VYLSEWKDAEVVSGTQYCGGQLLRHPEEGQEPKPSWYFTVCVPKDKVWPKIQD